MEGESEDAVGGGEDVDQKLVVWSLRLDEIEQTTSDLRESINDLSRNLTRLSRIAMATFVALVLLAVYVVWRFS
jgi:hypothetical protein